MSNAGGITTQKQKDQAAVTERADLDLLDKLEYISDQLEEMIILLKILAGEQT